MKSLFLAATLLFSSITRADEKIAFAFELTRHGARSPLE